MPMPATGAFYKYTDKDGRQVFVDDLGKIPQPYRGGATVYSEPKDRLNDSQRSKLEAIEAEKNRRARENYLQHIETINLRQATEAARQARTNRKIQQGAMETPITVSNNQILVPVTIAHLGVEVETQLLLDTGASIITLHKSIARQLKIAPSMRSRAKVVGGTVIRAGFMQLSYVRVGPLTVKGPVAGFIDHTGPPVAFGGYLGMNILKEANFRIDFDRKVIRWLPEPDNR
ncbi:MAG: aspartyl protease family protein [Desulfobacterales bacterium]|nr:aspartyl protease family protein [Desulfobacterales bacterium]